MKWILPLMLLALVVFPACSRASANGDVDPKAIEAKYGLTGGYVGEITTPDGKIKATIIPTTLADGRQAQLVAEKRGIKESAAKKPTNDITNQ